ncbi:MAG: hypothetical protein ACRDU8_11185 [Egibacteraceae bacterium]
MRSFDEPEAPDGLYADLSTLQGSAYLDPRGDSLAGDSPALM